jgi:hypothetical protein
LEKELEDPIPEEWDEEWKKRLLEARENEDISSIFWQGNEEQWLEDLDFLLEVLTLRQGKNWRQVNQLTNPLWHFAKTSIYPEFVKRLIKLPLEKRNKILDNIKKVNKSKHAVLLVEIKFG